MYNKYKNKKTIVDGLEFDSKAESEYYIHLKRLKTKGVIESFDMQKKMLLQNGYKLSTSKRQVMPIYYIVDFVVYYPDGSKSYVDVKGMKTAVFNLKRKMFEYRYKVPLILAKKKGSVFEHEFC